MPKTLDLLQPGEAGIVAQVTGDPAITERLMEMGLIAGTPFKVIKRAPLGDPIEIETRGYHLTIRKGEAAGIVLQERE
jgi:ferrous iron transport protein A